MTTCRLQGGHVARRCRGSENKCGICSCHLRPRASSLCDVSMATECTPDEGQHAYSNVWSVPCRFGAHLRDTLGDG